MNWVQGKVFILSSSLEILYHISMCKMFDSGVAYVDER
jgi:hypothetical protein